MHGNYAAPALFEPLSPGNGSHRREIKRATILKVYRVEAAWLRIVGVLLIALGAVLFVSPYVSFSTREQLRNTPLSVKREKTLAIPGPVLIHGKGPTVISGGDVSVDGKPQNLGNSVLQSKVKL